MKKYIAIAAIGSLALSCAECTIESPNSGESSESVTLTVSIAQDPESRVMMAENSESLTWSASWEQGDVLGGWYSGSPSALSKFTMENYDAKSATFSGPAGSGSLRLIYPYSEDAIITDGLYTLDFSNQVCEIDEPMERLTTHLIGELGGVAMKHLAAYINLNLQFTGLDTQRYSYTLSHVEFGTQNQVDKSYAEVINAQQIILAESSLSDIYGEESVGAITIGLNGSSSEVVNSTIYTIRFASLPFSIEPNEWIGVDIYLTQKDNMSGDSTIYCYTDGSLQNTATESVEFARGTYNAINLAVDTSSADNFQRSSLTTSGDNILPADFYDFESEAVSGWAYTSGCAASNSSYYNKDNGGSKSLKLYSSATPADGIYAYATSASGKCGAITAGVYILDHWFQTFKTNTAAGGYEIRFKSTNSGSDWETLGKYSITPETAESRSSNQTVVVFDKNHSGGYIGIWIDGDNIVLEGGTTQTFFDSIALFATGLAVD